MYRARPLYHQIDPFRADLCATLSIHVRSLRGGLWTTHLQTEARACLHTEYSFSETSTSKCSSSRDKEHLRHVCVLQKKLYHQQGKATNPFFSAGDRLGICHGKKPVHLVHLELDRVVLDHVALFVPRLVHLDMASKRNFPRKQRAKSWSRERDKKLRGLLQRRTTQSRWGG